MSLLTIDEARAQCRVEADYPAEQLQPYIDGAEDDAAGYLNRAIFADQATLDAARDAVPAALGAAQDAYDAAVIAAAAINNDAEAQATLDVADARLADAKQSAARTVNGIVVDAGIKSAVRLTLGHLFANREAVVAGQAMELPLGAQSLLRPKRRVMMP